MQMDSVVTNVTDERAGADEELRLALSMRGGVSLAVWIGGAVAEIEALRTAVVPVAAGPHDAGASGQRTVYRRLASLARYETVTVDVLSGASAGGLNGAIYAASLVYGFDFAEMADLWLTLADIEALSRPTPWRPGEGRRPSLLEGDAYFLTELERRLAELMAPAGMGPAATGSDQRLDLFLSATRKDPVERVLRNDPFADIHESRSAAFFHFRHLGAVGSPLSDFPAADVGLAARRLALAGRASSSFPVAFEPANVWSAPTVDDGALNMLGIFSEIDDQPVRVIDGGVLDNIPVARAIQAIAAAPASGPTSRWLLYLHPSPTEPEPSDPRPPRAAEESLTGILSDLGTTVRLKFDGESLVEDMLELDRHNREVAVRSAVRVALLADAAVAEVGVADTAHAAWAGIDSRRVTTVLIDPDLAMATHPFVREGFGSVLDSWPPGVRATFFEVLPTVLESVYAAGGAADPAPLLALGDTVEVLLRLSQQISGADAADTEADLYRVRLLVEVLHSVWEQHWAAAARQPPAPDADADAVSDWSTRVASAALAASEHVTAAVIDSIGSGASTPFHHALAELFDAAPLAPGEVPLGEIWVLVAGKARVLLDAATAQGLDDPLVVFLAQRVDLLEGLVAAARASASLHRRVMSGESAIRFLRVSGANRSPLESWFTGGEPLSVTDKLAGNQFVNFGAFFSARWRANDWMWGRLDGAKSLVDLLADSTRWFSGSGRTAEQVIAGVEAAVTTPFDPAIAGAPDWDDWMRDEWARARATVIDEIEAAAVTPDVAAGLTETKRLMVTRLHAEHLARELPWVDATPRGVTTGVARGDGVDPTGAQDLASRLTAGTDSIPGDLEPRRWARIGMRLGLNVWRALRPKGWVARGVTALLKPVYLFLLGVVVYPSRALLAGVVGYAALTLGRWETESEWWWSGPWRSADAVGYGTWARRAAFVTTMVLVVLLVVVQGRAFLRRREPAALVGLGAGLGIGGFVFVEYAVNGASYAPIVVPLAAAVVVLLGMWWMSPPGARRLSGRGARALRGPVVSRPPRRRVHCRLVGSHLVCGGAGGHHGVRDTRRGLPAPTSRGLTPSRPRGLLGDRSPASPRSLHRRPQR